MSVDSVAGSRSNSVQRSQTPDGASGTQAGKAEEKDTPKGYDTKDVFEAAHASGPDHAHGSDEPHAADEGGGAAGGEKHFHNAKEARAEGERIVDSHTDNFGWRLPPWSKEVDRKAIADDLIKLARDPSHSQAERAVVIDGAIDKLEGDDKKEVAKQIVDAFKPEELDSIGRSGIESLKDALGTGDDTKAQREKLEAELARRGPVKDVTVNGVRIVGDEVSQEAIDATIEQVKRLTSNPEVAKAMQGQTIVVVPRDEKGTDQEMVYEAMGLHDQKTADGRTWDGVAGGASGKFMYIAEGDVVNTAGEKQGMYVLNHEFTHGVQFNYVNNLSADDPRLTALLEPGTKVADQNGDGKLTGYDVLKMAWDQRIKSGNVPDDYSKVNEAEWFAQAGSSFTAEQGKGVPRDAQWLYDHDRPLYDLLTSIYGATPQTVDTEKKAAA